VKRTPWPPRFSRLHLTSALVIGSPSDHFAPSTSLKVIVRRSSETSHDCAIPGAGARLSGLKLTSRS
jgi:hypothetical protein